MDGLMRTYRNKLNNMKEITDEELTSFLEGTLPEEREKEVAEAIDNSKELQEIIEASLDIDDIMMFEELRLVQHNSHFARHHFQIRCHTK